MTTHMTHRATKDVWYVRHTSHPTHLVPCGLGELSSHKLDQVLTLLRYKQYQWLQYMRQYRQYISTAIGNWNGSCQDACGGA